MLATRIYKLHQKLLVHKLCCHDPLNHGAVLSRQQHVGSDP